MRDAFLVRLTERFGLHPWDVDRLEVEDFLRYCRAIDETLGG